MTEDIRVYELRRLDLRGATVIDGFPSVGLVSTITANYLISLLKLEQIGVLDSKYFPTVSIIRDAEPLNPVRIYASDPRAHGEDYPPIVVFISEFQPPANLVKLIASTILDWIEEQMCSLLISPEGLVIDRESMGETESEEIVAYGVGSTERARTLLEANGIPLFKEGVISGVAGVLLNEGKRRGFDVINVLAEARPNYPDARAAAKVIEAIDKLIPHIHIDVEPLYAEAENIELKLKSTQRLAQIRERRAPTAPEMYG
jgi:uncharacterized protein